MFRRHHDATNGRPECDPRRILRSPMVLRPASLTALLLLVGCRVAHGPVVLNDDGGWCWFQDERALALGDVVVVGSVAAGRTDPARRGGVELSCWWPATNEVRRVVLHEALELDDHDAPALLQLADGRLLATYTTHGNDRFVRWRRTVRAGDPLDWQDERRFELTAESRLGVTYSNLHHSADGEVLDFFRGVDWDPNLIVSRDAGETWEWAGRLLGGPGRPYVKYASSARGTVHFIATEQHPRDFDNGLYHGFLRGRTVHSSAGIVLGSVGAAPPAPEALTCVFEGRSDAVAWPVDLELDARGLPVALFSVQVDGAGLARGQGGLDQRLYYARFDGKRWHVHELAYAGTRLYAGEDDYTGLAAIDPGEPSVVYLATDAHPATGRALVSSADGARHHELFRASTGDAGASWTFEALTANSSADNLRPIVPSGSPRVLLWLRGSLASYTDYALEVVGLPID